jgi:hypothetical protein
MKRGQPHHMQWADSRKDTRGRSSARTRLSVYHSVCMSSEVQHQHRRRWSEQSTRSQQPRTLCVGHLSFAVPLVSVQRPGLGPSAASTGHPAQSIGTDERSWTTAPWTKHQLCHITPPQEEAWSEEDVEAGKERRGSLEDARRCDTVHLPTHD